MDLQLELAKKIVRHLLVESMGNHRADVARSMYMPSNMHPVCGTSKEIKLTRQHFIGSLNQHELIGSIFVAQILVGMVLQNQLAMFLLDDGNIGILLTAKHIIVALDGTSIARHDEFFVGV